MGGIKGITGEVFSLLPISIIILALDNEADRIKAGEIFKLYYGFMINVTNKILIDRALAEDAASEAMIRIIRNLDNISDVSSDRTKSYIYVTVWNAAKSLYAKRKRFKEDGDDELDMIPDRGVSALEGLTTDESVENIIKAIETLPEKLSDVLLLSAAYDRTHTEISEELGISKDAVKMRLLRAKKAVRQILEGEQDV